MLSVSVGVGLVLLGCLELVISPSSFLLTVVFVSSVFLFLSFVSRLDLAFGLLA
jgi:hypothetical protein